jgi:hypothetical protein
MVEQSQALNSIFFNIDAGHVHGPKLSFRALTLHFAIVVNAVRTRVLLQSFPLCPVFLHIVILCTHNLPC